MSIEGRRRAPAAGTEVQYPVHTMVLCKDTNGLYYDAKVVAVEDSSDMGITYKLHYQGWSPRFDTRVSGPAVQDRLLPPTEENLRMAKEMRDRAGCPIPSRRGRKKLSIIAPGTDVPELRGDVSLESSSARTPSARKRGRRSRLEKQVEGELEPPKREIIIELPDSFFKILESDRDRIVSKKWLVKVPARFTISAILDEYVTHIEGLEEQIENLSEAESYMVDDAKDCVKCIKDYFGVYLRSRLLYRPEYLQYKQLLARENEGLELGESSSAARTPQGERIDYFSIPELKPSLNYGFIHLVRLLSKFGEILSDQDWSAKPQSAIDLCVEQVTKFIRFLEEKHELFYNPDEDYVLKVEHRRMLQSVEIGP